MHKVNKHDDDDLHPRSGDSLTFDAGDHASETPVSPPSARTNDPNLTALIVAVRALDPAAADDAPYHHWDAARWAVFNAAVRFVREKS